MKSVRTKWILQFLFLIVTSNAGAVTVREEAVTLDTPTGKLAGTLQLPSSAGKVPVALIIAGSGPTDRDGNSSLANGRNDSLKMLAQALADAGVASLRYDKRGLAGSAAARPVESELRFDTFVHDAAEWADKLKGDPRFSSLIVIGHSEGSLIGMLAAQRAKADAFISLAGVAQAAPAIMRKQLAGKLPPVLAAENERILAALERGEPVGDVPPALGAWYRPGLQPYLISWFKYVPAQHIATLKIPVLIAQGTTDIQVDVEEAQALKAAKPDAVLVIIPGMNHVLKLVPADMQQQVASYGNPALPLAPQLVSAIGDFLHSSVPPRSGR
jgi:alpha-beta hydrolase superfamily lysophospholipase